jgi:hypothetical protein
VDADHADEQRIGSDRRITAVTGIDELPLGMRVSAFPKEFKKSLVTGSRPSAPIRRSSA